MATKSKFKTLTLGPLTGPMNPVKTADELVPGEFSYKQNFGVSKVGRLARDGGFEEFLELEPGGGDPRLSDVRHLMEIPTVDGVRRLIAADLGGKVSMLATANAYWSDLGGTFKDTGAWSSASSGNMLLISDGEGLLHYAHLPSGSLIPLPSLEMNFISGAKVVIEFAGCVFIMNSTEGGYRWTSRVRWSALNQPLVWVSADDNIAGFQDLSYGQTILAAGVLGDRLMIYTDTSIWSVRATGDSRVFGFTQLYSSPTSRSKCLAHSRSLVSVGSLQVFVGRDGVYAFSPYDREPQRLEWLDSCARLLFEPGSNYTLSQTACDVVSGFNSDTQELWLSWEGNVGDYTIVANTLVKTCDVREGGWHAFSIHARKVQQSFADWLDIYVPDNDELWFTPSNVSHTELCTKTMADFCSSCADSPLFVGVLKEDGSLKALTNRLDGTRILGHSVEGVSKGYTSILRGVVPAGMGDHDKVLRRFVVDVVTDANTSSNANLVLRTGISQQAHNPNDLGSNLHGIKWTTHPVRALGPDPEGKSMDDLEGSCQLRDLPVEWNLMERGKFIYWELSIVGDDGQGTVLFNTLELSRIEFEVRTVVKK